MEVECTRLRNSVEEVGNLVCVKTVREGTSR